MPETIFPLRKRAVTPIPLIANNNMYAKFEKIP